MLLTTVINMYWYQIYNITGFFLSNADATFYRLMPLAVGATPRPRRAVKERGSEQYIKREWVKKSSPFAAKKVNEMRTGERTKVTMNIPRMIVARPRAVPIPLPLIAFGPTRLNLSSSTYISQR